VDLPRAIMRLPERLPIGRTRYRGWPTDMACDGHRSLADNAHYVMYGMLTSAPIIPPSRPRHPHSRGAVGRLSVDQSAVLT
jgi:hypothetical protein